MINFLNSWASGVVVAVIVGSIIEMILPESNNKKYVKTIIGIFILFTIISPIIVRFSGGIDLKSIIDYDDYVNSVPVSSSNIISNDDILEVYKNNIIEEITNTVEQEGYKVIKINISVSSKEKNYGEILEIRLTAEENDTKVEKINIDISNEKETAKEMSESEKKKIKDILNTTYGVAKDKIFIN